MTNEQALNIVITVMSRAPISATEQLGVETAIKTLSESVLEKPIPARNNSLEVHEESKQD